MIFACLTSILIENTNSSNWAQNTHFGRVQPSRKNPWFSCFWTLPGRSRTDPKRSFSKVLYGCDHNFQVFDPKNPKNPKNKAFTWFQRKAGLRPGFWAKTQKSLKRSPQKVIVHLFSSRTIFFSLNRSFWTLENQILTLPSRSLKTQKLP